MNDVEINQPLGGSDMGEDNHAAVRADIMATGFQNYQHLMTQAGQSLQLSNSLLDRSSIKKFDEPGIFEAKAAQTVAAAPPHFGPGQPTAGSSGG